VSWSFTMCCQARRRTATRSSATIISILIVIALSMSCVCFAQEPVSRMEQVIQSYVDGKKFMGTVLVAQNGKILLDKGYGSANLEWNIPDSPSTKFRIGSMTKQFTAAAILLLEERGKLKTDDLIKKYMPDAPAAWDKITIFNLLTHTSGIPSFTSFPDYRSTEATPTTPEKLVERFRDKPLDFQPGEKWDYSNSGYVLLGYLLEKISGQTYKEFIQENIFKPLGMNDSGYDSNSAIIPHRASGYTPTPNGPVNAGYIDMTIPFSAGALYSTTDDLLRWEQGLFGGKVLSAASLKKMTTPFKNDYAFGLGVRSDKGHTVIEHGGGIEGFNTQMSYFPEDKLTVIVLSNLNGGAPAEIAPKLASVARGEAVVLPSERKEITVPKDVLTQYVGTYELTPNFSIVVTLEGDQLMTQATHQPKVPMFAESPTRFFLKVVDAEVQFSKDPQGKVNSLTLYQGGREVKGTKK
jgi:CubicO group peptidase (beta-lactamase class C family)